MKKTTLKAVSLFVSAIAINVAYADDGGLMADMMAKNYPAKMVSGPAVQAHLSTVKIASETHGNGGLMQEMMNKRFPIQSVHGDSVQEQLTQVSIPVSGNK